MNTLSNRISLRNAAEKLIRKLFLHHFHVVCLFTVPGGWQLAGRRRAGGGQQGADSPLVHRREPSSEQHDHGVNMAHNRSCLFEGKRWGGAFPCCQRTLRGSSGHGVPMFTILTKQNLSHLSHFLFVVQMFPESARRLARR